MGKIGHAPASLEALIAGSEAKGWRQCLVEDPRLFAWCEQRMVRKQGSDLFLLTKSRLIGYYTEIRGYALYLKLERLRKAGSLEGITHLQHLPVYGTDSYPGFEFRAGGRYVVWFSAGNWKCLRDGQEHPLPPNIATVAQSIT